MAITDKEEGVWGLDQVYNKINQGGIWSYTVPGGDPVSLFIWGNDAQGKLGLNETTGNLSSPTQIPGNWSPRSGPYTQSDGCIVAPKTDGTLWSWGNNEAGELGINDRTKRSSPTQIGSGTDWYRATGNHITGAAFKTDGTLWVWGSNSYGSLGINQTGQGNANNRSSPTQLPGTWNADGSHNVGGAQAKAAIKTDGTLWVWGWNQSGDLGLNEGGTPPQGGTYYSSPTQMGTDTTWGQVSAGPGGGLASKTDGTLWAWGNNNDGRLGQNARTQYSSPVQVPGTTWSTGLGDVTVLRGALKTDGTAWVWGGNSYYGTLGLNQGPGQSSGYSSPTQLPGTWIQIQRSGSYNALGFK